MPPGMGINPSQHCLFMIILRQCRRMIGRMNQWCGWLPGKVYLTWSTARCWVLCMLVTGNPLGSDLFEMTSPASVVQGQELFGLHSSTLGDTLDGLPGVASTGYGPNASPR